MDCEMVLNSNGSARNLATIVVLEELVSAASLLSLILNAAAVVLVLARARPYRGPFAALLCSLALSDALTSSTSVYVSVRTALSPANSVVATDVPLAVYALLTTGVLSGTYGVLAIGVERHLAVRGARKGRVQLRSRVLKVLGLCWTLAVVVGSLPLFGWNCAYSGVASTLYGPLCINYLLFVVVPNTMVVFAVLSVTYVAVIVKLRELNSRSTRIARAETRVTRTAWIIWGLALVAYTPFLAGVLWDASHSSCPEKLKTSVIVYKDVAYAFLVLNSIGNPIVYTFSCPDVWRLARWSRWRRRRRRRKANRVNVCVNTVSDTRLF
ncbi:lysophosphatidic acid receptor 3-like [Salminus brasiliensis]|uniref:lysophosphatidic acid receptor 3-like n=1 Tax=Salminus brasiliensis TaxID=930266 RepID=UPI003B8321E8